MTLKNRILAILEEKKGQHISGSEMAEKLNVSRNAVWKAVKQLQKEGYRIEAGTNRGYCMSSDNSILSEQSIRKYLHSNNFQFELLKTVTSTNSLLKQKAESGALEGSVIIAEEQTMGRGRFGHNFYSPPQTGIYMSLLLRPELSAPESLSITTCAAVAVAKAIELNSGKKAEIKWVNDIFCDNKKVSGILTEASFNIEGGGIDYVILGIGVNVFPPKDNFPDDLDDIATSVYNMEKHNEDFRSRIIADILNFFMEYYPDITRKTFFDEYKRRSMVLSKPIYVIRNGNREEAVALDIDDMFRLKVRLKDGTITYLNSGEISIRQR